MIRNRFRRSLTLALLLTPGLVRAQTPPAAPSPETAPKPAPLTLRFERTPLETVARQLGEQAGRGIVLDTGVRRSNPVTLSAEAASLEDALNKVTGPLALSWKKIYLPKREKTLSAEEVRNAARALELFEGRGVILEEPAIGTATLFMRSVPAAAAFEAKVKTTWPHMQPYYLITSPRAAAQRESVRRDAARKQEQPSIDDYLAIERRQLDLFMRLSPEERAAGIARSMDLMLQMDPAVMQEMMQAGMQAWIQSMQKMTPEQRQEFIRRSMQMMQSIPPSVWQDAFGLFRQQ
jgi:hypothetical protein